MYKMDVGEILSNSRNFVDELEKHRSPWESATHWAARKTFLRHNWENVENKTRLICLSQAWANVHFSGNRYGVFFLYIMYNKATNLAYYCLKKITNCRSLPNIY